MFRSFFLRKSRSSRHSVTGSGGSVRRARKFTFESLEQRRLLSATPIGNDFRVNSYTTDQQSAASVALDANGAFVAAWQSPNNGTGVWEIAAKQFGGGSGNEFRVNSMTTGDQKFPAAAMDADGDFVIVWAAYPNNGGTYGVFGRRFSASGSPIGSDFQISSNTGSPQQEPAIAMDADGDFVVAWQDSDIHAQRYNAAGVPVGTEFLVHSSRTAGHPAVAMNVAGDFVVTYFASGTADTDGIYARRFSAEGLALGSEFLVNQTTTGRQDSPSVAMDADGDFVIAWRDASDIKVRRFNAVGAPLSGELQVNNSGNGSSPSIAANYAGDFAVSFLRTTGTSTTDLPFARKYTKNGVAEGVPFSLYTTSLDSDDLRLAMDVDGDFVAAWHENTFTGDVHARRADDATLGNFAGPVIANVYAGGTRVLSGSELANAVSQFMIAFSENLENEATSSHGVNNQVNWTLHRDGLDASESISSITFAFNSAANRYEAIVTFSGLLPGNYVLVAKDTIQDVNDAAALDGNYDGAPGGDYQLTFSILSTDFGDAPAPYATHLNQDGARHLTTGPTLGALRDNEFDGQADDGSDEDGVVLPNYIEVSSLRSTTATIAVNAPAGGILDGWIDFNRDGDWNDAGERILNRVATNVGNSQLTVAIPQGTTPGSTWSRFRISSAGSPSPLGLASDGEVEDYPITLASTTIVVDTSNDTNDGVGINGTSLREAILATNADPTLDRIEFNIPGSGPRTISVLSALPTITDAVTIDGTSQPGFTDQPLIELRGDQAGLSTSGLVLGTSGNTIRGLIIDRFKRHGILITSAGVGGNLIAGNFIGIGPNGNEPSFGNGLNGVYIQNSPGNVVGGTAAADRNVISGNGANGIDFDGSGSSNSTVLGNWIGTDHSGTVAVPNSSHGILITNGAAQNAIGASFVGATNLISGNAGQGVYIDGGGQNTIVGNLIGTNLTGMTAIPNGGAGVLLNSGTTENTVGGTSAGSVNVISGNAAQGINITSSHQNTVLGNLIGTSVAGMNAVPNGAQGLLLNAGASRNVIGGVISGARNIISGNTQSGVHLNGSDENVIQGNLIGTNVIGGAAIPNSLHGIVVTGGASQNSIGGATASAGNTISGNGIDGITISGSETSENSIQGNRIGTNSAGTTALPNIGYGISVLQGATDNSIGGPLAGAGNLISGNGADGIAFADLGTSRNEVQGNLIGTDVLGNVAISNFFAGVVIGFGASENLVGGTDASAGNTISGNDTYGVIVLDNNTQLNSIQGNLIGLNSSGTAALPNGAHGVGILRGASSNTVGGSSVGAGNTISGNGLDGVTLGGNGTIHNQVLGNRIGLNLAGSAAVPNTYFGVSILSGASNNTIGAVTPGAGNVIAGNHSAGVVIAGGGAGNSVRGNSIYENGELGIDLDDDGVTPNDLGDTDVGTNLRQNSPVLQSATTSGTAVYLRGTVNSTPNASFALDFYSNPSNVVPVDDHQGRTYLGTITVTTNPSGIATFDTVFPTAVVPDSMIAATTTDGMENTSEFSPAIAAVPVLQVISLTPNATGFTATFNRELATSELNLFDEGGLFGASDLTVAGVSSGDVRGSLVLESPATKMRFIKSGSVLAPDVYTVTMRSHVAGFKDLTAGLLDGNVDGLPGGDFSTTFNLEAPSPATVVLSVDDFVRAHDQLVNVPASMVTGIPVRISNAQGVKSATFTLTYDPTLLDISGATVGSGITGTVTIDSPLPGVAQISVSSSDGLNSTSGPRTLVNLIAAVPNNAPYGQKHILDLSNLQLLDLSPVPLALPAIDDDGIHIAAYFGDANGSQSYNAPDATLAQRLIVGSNTGLSAYQLADPYLVVDITSNGQVQSDDVTQIQRAIVGLSTPEIPVFPGLGPVVSDGPDPIASISRDLKANVGEIVTVPIEVVVTTPADRALAGTDRVRAFGAYNLELTKVEVGRLLIGAGLSENTTTPSLVRPSPLEPVYATRSVLVMHFSALGVHGGSSSANLLGPYRSSQTALYDANGQTLSLVPSLTDMECDSIDGLLTVQAASLLRMVVRRR